MCIMGDINNYKAVTRDSDRLQWDGLVCKGQRTPRNAFANHNCAAKACGWQAVSLVTPKLQLQSLMPAPKKLTG